jgi:hypothetical protein
MPEKPQRLSQEIRSQKQGWLPGDRHRYPGMHIT